MTGLIARRPHPRQRAKRALLELAPSSHHRAVRGIRLTRDLACVLAGFAAFAATAARAQTGPVRVYPSPGTRAALPATQIAFRGISPGALRVRAVLGSRSGLHAGRIVGDSDRQGGSFIPDRPFAPGETVTVHTTLNIFVGRDGTFRFKIARPVTPMPPTRIPLVLAGATGVEHFRSRPDLSPARMVVTTRTAPSSLGDIFVAPEFGPLQDGPMLLDPRGRLLWFHPLPRSIMATDFRKQTLWGRPVLTWWQGRWRGGATSGDGIIVDRRYRRIADVHAGNGLTMDAHEFIVTPHGQAWIIAASRIRWPRVTHSVLDYVIQEIDIRTGLVEFEWHAIDHVPLADSVVAPRRFDPVFDAYHLNSLAFDPAGNLIASMRNTSAVYDINRRTGAVLWTLGGRHSSFVLSHIPQIAFQHDVSIEPDGTLDMFDNGGGTRAAHQQSRAIRLALDTTTMTARLVQQYEHYPPLFSPVEGSVQPLPGGEVFVGWGFRPYITEYDTAGTVDFDAHFNTPTPTYRAYRFPWSGQPAAPPRLIAKTDDNGTVTVYASWNGATDVSAWRVLAGPASNNLSAAATEPSQGFETTIRLRTGAACLKVQALSPTGAVLSTSHTLRERYAPQPIGARHQSRRDTPRRR